MQAVFDSQEDVLNAISDVDFLIVARRTYCSRGRMKQSKKKKKNRPRDTKKEGVSAQYFPNPDNNIFVESFGSISMNDAAAALTKAAETAAEDQTTTCSSSSGNYDFCSSSSSNASDPTVDTNYFLQDVLTQKNRAKMKKVVASTGMVSSVLGKDYSRSIPKKSKLEDVHEDDKGREEAEQFLYSMLGSDTELSLALVGDVLCQCGYNVDKALDILLELSSSSRNNSNESNISLTDGVPGPSSNSDFHGNLQFTGNFFRNLRDLPESGETQASDLRINSDSELPQKVLESLFNMPVSKNSEQDPETMNWKIVVEKMASLCKEFEPDTIDPMKLRNANGREYQVLRESANQHWDSMKSYYKKATTAFTNGNKAYAAHLSEQGRLQNKMAREADEKASHDIFASRNSRIENVITIDLHGQHVKQAMKLLKLHLLFGASVRSVMSFRVITGYSGKSRLKNSVIKLVEKEGIWWREENNGSLIIRLQHEQVSNGFRFLDSDSDCEL